ncbi:MAG: MATE family efflux transporter [Lachnospiraceae bacterium]|nr:MATE family efflux transporter [Lachnospiraceae bacterium]
MTQEEKFQKMTTEPVSSLVGRLAVPTILSMLVTSFYNMVDTYFVGKISTSASGAVGVVFSLMAIIQAFGFMFGHGSGNFLARKLGEKKEEEAEIIANAGFFFAFSFGVIFSVAGLLNLDRLAYLLGSTDTILPYARSYMGPILVGAPWMMASIVLNNEIRYQGNAKTAMFGIMAGAVINIGLDPLLMFVFKLGIMGAALATISGQLVSFFILLWTTGRAGNIKITLKRNPFAFRYLWEIVSGGLPSLFRQGLASVSGILLNVVAKKVAGPLYADATIAGMAIVSKISMSLNSTVIGFGQGFQPVCSFNFGAARYKRVKEAFLFSVKVCAALMLVVTVVCFLFAPFIVEIFRKGDAKVLEVGAFALRAQSITYVFGVWIILTNMLLQASGRAFGATVISSCRSGLCFIPIILIIPHFLGITGVQISQALADMLAFCISLFGGLYFLRKLDRMEAEGKAVKEEAAENANSKQ